MRYISITVDHDRELLILFNDIGNGDFSFAPQINVICSLSYKLLRNLAYNRKFLSTDDLRVLVQSIITSHIDNCNSLLYGVLATKT